MKRNIRISSFNDYVAIDVVDDKDKILSTPLYLHKSNRVAVKVKDFEEHTWERATVEFLGDGMMKIVCDDNISWEDNVKELLDESQFKFYEQSNSPS